MSTIIVPIDPEVTGGEKPPVPKPPPSFSPWKTREHVSEPRLPPTLDPLDAYGIFSLFFGPNQYKLIAENTNKNAVIKNTSATEKSRKWTPITPAEVRLFLALHIYMGIYQEPNIQQYWSTKQGCNHQIVRKALGLQRYQQIERFFHISDPEQKGDTFSKVYLQKSLKKYQLIYIRWNHSTNIFKLSLFSPGKLAKI